MTTRTSTTPITPISLPANVRGAVVFGGSFDPPHLWHTRIASAARRELCGTQGWIIFVPAARSPLKGVGPIASDSHRLSMLQLATRRTHRCVIWTDELDRARADANQPSYTIETLQRLHKVLTMNRSRSAPTLRLLIGADQAVSFQKWREAASIVGLAEPAVALRPPLDTPDRLAAAMRATGCWSGDELLTWRARILRVQPRALSSTDVRKAGRRETQRSGSLHTEVRAYIDRHRLYERP